MTGLPTQNHLGSVPVATRGPLVTALQAALTRRSIWFLVVAAIRVTYWRMFPAPVEDACITYQYVDFGYRPEWGVTSFVWLWLLRGVRLLGVHPHHGAVALSVAADLLAAWFSLARIEGARRALFAGLWSLPLLSAACVSGIESHFGACMLILGALRWPVLLALGAAMRPDTALAATVLGILLARRATIVPVLAGVAVQAALSLHHVGSVLPSTVLTKSVVYATHWFKGLAWLFPLAPWYPSSPSPDLQALARLSPWFAASLVLALWRRPWPPPPTVAIGLAALTPLIVFWVVGAPYFWWYAAWPLALLTPLGAQHFPVFEGGRLMHRVSAALLGMMIFASGFEQWRAHLERYRYEQDFVLMGRTLRQMSHREDVVMLEPVGIIPYISERTPIDECGLMTPWVAERRRQGDGWRTDIIDQWKPRFLVFRYRELLGIQFAGVGRAWRTPQERDRIMADYEEVARGVYTQLVLFKRRT